MMTGDRYLDHLAYFFTIFRWILVYIDVIIISLAIPGFALTHLVVAGTTGAALFFNIAVSLADRKARNRIPGELEFQVPRCPVITGDFILAILYLSLWALHMYVSYSYMAYMDYEFELHWEYRFYSSAYVMTGTMVMWHFHLIFAIVNIIRRRRITRIVQARRLGPLSMALNDQDWSG